jgi:hypothetical protein
MHFSSPKYSKAWLISSGSTTRNERKKIKIWCASSVTEKGILSKYASNYFLICKIRKVRGDKIANQGIKTRPRLNK